MNPILDNKNLYGALLIVLGGITSTFIGSLTHSLEPIGAPQISALQILFMKSSIGLITLIVIFRSRITKLLQTKIFHWHMCKGICAALGSWAWILALQHLSLATCSALSLTSALFTSLGGIFFFKEKISWQLWGCIFIGFAGVLIILQPSNDIFSFYMLLPLVSAIAFSASSLLVKILSLKDSSETTLLYMLFFLTILSLPFAVFYWQPISIIQTFKICAIGMLYAFTQLLLIEAYTHANASFIAPFKYTRFPLNISAEILFFSRWPGFNEIWGGLLIATSSLYMIWHEKRYRTKLKK